MATRFMGRVENAPPQTGRGTQTTLFHISASLSLVANDVYRIGKLPHGAIPVGAVFFGTAKILAKFGTSNSQELFFNSATWSLANHRSANVLGSTKQISVSDDAPVRYDYVTMVPSDLNSLGAVGDLVVTYLMPGQTL